MFRVGSTRFLRPALAASAALATVASVHHLRKYHVHNSRPSTSTTTSTNPSLLPPNSHIALAESLPSLSEASAVRAGLQIPGVPTISAAQVRQNNGQGAEARIWVGYGHGVYDVTEFVGAHPGGDYILRAAGGPLEPFWRLYAQHNAEWVLEILEEMRIGNLEPDERWRSDAAEGADAKGGTYRNEPVRSAKLIVQGETPFNAEPEMRLLVQNQLTPNELFYVRNHMPVPLIEPQQYRLEVVDTDGESLATLTLEELSKFPKYTVAATVQCAGNRRNELNSIKKVKGGRWEAGAISNAEWGGARLADVIAYARGMRKKVHKTGGQAKHVCFEGLDEDGATGTTYAASVPMDVMERVPDVLLAYEMNGETLPRDHGYPVRVVVPGIVGARCVKWVGRVVLSEEESDSHWQRQDYRSFSPDVDWDTVDFSSSPSIQEMPVVSVICDHRVDKEKETVAVSGYAWSGDGKGIIRVDVSGDGGRTWRGAQLRDKGEMKRNRTYDWTLWDAVVEMPKEGKMELVCKAIDSAYNTQPEGPEGIWNLRGLLNNSWHRVEIEE